MLVLAFMFGKGLDVEVLERTLAAALKRYPYLAGHVEHCVGTCFDESNQQHCHEHGHPQQSSSAVPVPEEERSVVRRHGVDRTSLSSSSSIDRSSSFSHTHDGSMCIVLSKQGVVWVEKESDMGLSDLLPVQMKEFSWPPLGIKTEFQLPAMEELYPPLPSPYDTCYNREHLLRVCVTKLVDGSMSLVVAVPHLVTDLAPLKGLMKTWSSEYSKLYASVKGRQPRNELMSPIVGLMPSIEEIRDVASTVSGEMMDRTRKMLMKKEMNNGAETRKRDERYISYTIESVKGPIVPRNMVTLKRILWKGMQACHLHRSRLDAFKQKAKQDAQADNRCPVSWISDNDIICARIWQIIARGCSKKPRMLLLSANERKRCSPQLSEDSWGNCLGTIPLGLMWASDAHEKTISELSVIIRERVAVHASKAYEEDYAQCTKILHDGNGLPRMVHASDKCMDDPILVSNWNWSPEYEEVSFDDQTPIWHQPGDMNANNMVVITPVPPLVSGGGYIITFQLPKNLIKLDDNSSFL